MATYSIKFGTHETSADYWNTINEELTMAGSRDKVFIDPMLSERLDKHNITNYPGSYANTVLEKALDRLDEMENWLEYYRNDIPGRIS